MSAWAAGSILTVPAIAGAALTLILHSLQQSDPTSSTVCTPECVIAHGGGATVVGQLEKLIHARPDPLRPEHVAQKLISASDQGVYSPKRQDVAPEQWNSTHSQGGGGGGGGSLSSSQGGMKMPTESTAGTIAAR